MKTQFWLMRMAVSALIVLAMAGCDEDPAAVTAAPELSPKAREAVPAIPAATLSLQRKIDEKQLRADVKTISSDEFAGRGPGEIGEQVYVPWMIKQYQAIGLKPGNGDSYTQTVPMLEIQNTVSVPLSFKVAGKTLTFEAGKDFTLASKSPAEKIRLDASDVIFMGYGVDSSAENWNDYQDVDVKGKTVIVLINDPGFHVGDETLFKGKSMTYAGRWSYKFEEAARKGAAACLIVHDDSGAAYGWDVVKNGAARPEFTLVPKPGDAEPLNMHGWISAETTTALFSAAGLDFMKLRAEASKRGFKPVPLAATASAEITHRFSQKTSDNVLAKIEGSERPDEVIVYTAHWDHLGTNPKLEGDQIFNGAVDNATGIAALLEMARSLQLEKPKRSVLFLAVTLEESGLLGSRYYAENPSFALNKTVANLNIDAMRLVGLTKDVEVVGFGNSELEDILKVHAAAQDRVLAPEPTPQNGYFYRSDHFNFAKLGVPALYIKSGQDHREKGVAHGAAWSDAYTRDRYHKPGDEYREEDDYAGAAQDLELMSLVGLELANRSDFPNWYPSAEFKAARDAMMAPKK